MKTLEHITITTGAARASPRSEVSERTLVMIRAALAAGGNLWADWSVKLLPTPDGVHAFDLLHRKRHVARCWLSEADSEASTSLWEAAMKSGLDPNVSLPAPRSSPWLAASLTATGIRIGMQNPDVLIECGDLERCVAWAILE